MLSELQYVYLRDARDDDVQWALWSTIVLLLVHSTLTHFTKLTRSARSAIAHFFVGET